MPAELAARFGARSVTLSFAARNLKIWTNYSGIDPELNSISRSDGGLDDFQQSIEAFGVPIPRTLNFSIKVGL